MGMTETKHLSRSHYRICRGGHSKVNLVHMLPPNREEKSPFTPDLVAVSGLVLEFLGEAQKLTGFESQSKAEDHMKQYLCFLLLQEETPSEELIPSKEIQSIWFSHMLQSCAYKSFTQERFVNIWKLNHPVTRILAPDVRTTLENHTQKLMEERYPPGCDLQAHPNFTEHWETLVSQFTPEMVIRDRDWIVEFNKFTKGTDVKSVEFREKALFGYRRLIYLKFKNSRKVEAIGFSPCPSIDLVWHTHLVHPQTYEEDLVRVLGHAPMHKLLDLEDRTEAFMDTRDDQSMEMWQQHYHESIFVYAVV